MDLAPAKRDETRATVQQRVPSVFGTSVTCELEVARPASHALVDPGVNDLAKTASRAVAQPTLQKMQLVPTGSRVR